MKFTELTKDHEIICRSEQEWERIAKLLHKSGLRWASSASYCPLLYEWNENPMSYCLDGTFNDDETDFSDLVVESTDIDDEGEIMGTSKEDLSFKVGDKCWSPVYGHGEVVGFTGREVVGFTGQIAVVKFLDKTGWYQLDGRELPDSPQPTLFHQEVTDWPCPERPFELPKLNLDDKVYVGISGAWDARHFSHWLVNKGRVAMVVFSNGRTSHTSGGNTDLHTVWKISD